MNARAHPARPQLGFDLLRIYLGAGLVVRGALFATDPGLISQLIANDRWLVPMLAGHAIILAHLIGGLLLALGLYTRLAAAIQIPPVAGAVFVVHWSEGLFSRAQSLEFAALVLVALSLYAMFGSGALSMDHYLARKHPGASDEPARPTDLATAAARPRPALRGRASVAEDEAASDAPPPELVPPAESRRTREIYADTKLEVAIGALTICVLFVLLASGLHVAATTWLIVTFVMFGVWRIGRARFQ